VEGYRAALFLTILQLRLLYIRNVTLNVTRKLKSECTQESPASISWLIVLRYISRSLRL
jgi:hypothetical protein